VAIHVEPDILVIDEALSVGDAYFQAKCAKMIQSIICSGATVLFVSHDTVSVKSLCSRALLLYSGQNKYLGDVNTAVEKYYSALISSQSPDGSEVKELKDTFDFIIENHNFESMAGFQRIQSGLASFVNVVLLNEYGEPIEAVNFGQKVTLRQIIKVNSSLSKLGFAYHIRDRNGLDIIYSDSGIENESHIFSPVVGGFYQVDWSFFVQLREGEYSISSMASEPKNLKLGEVNVVDFIPISVKFSVSRGEKLPLYGAVYWKNELNFKRLNYAE
jgi:lipopolysaccharide transport system ATP-binding protein